MLSFEAQFDGKLALVWIDNTTITGSPSPQAIIDHLSASFSPKQREAIRRLSNVEQLSSECGSNFRSISKCFGGIVFNNIPKAGGAVDYALLADQAMYLINVLNQQSNEQQRIFPLQWAIDKARWLSFATNQLISPGYHRTSNWRFVPNPTGVDIYTSICL